MDNKHIQEKQELISVIIPVYQVEKYLSRCLDSVINQTYKNLEIILVDDGSTDASGDICDEYAKKDDRIKVIHKENGGLSSARNVGLDIMQGEYVAFVDSDDWIAPDMYEYLYQIMQDTGVDISVCYYKRTSGAEGKANKKKEQIKILEHDEIDNFFYRLNGEPSFYSVWNRLYRKSVVKFIRFWDGKINEDVLYTYEAYKSANSLAVSNQIKYYYFMNNKGLTRSGLSAKDFSLLEVWDRIVKDTEKTQYYDGALLNRKRASFTLCGKAKKHGCNESVDSTQLKMIKAELLNNAKELMHGKCLNIPRKILLVLLCIEYRFQNIKKDDCSL